MINVQVTGSAEINKMFKTDNEALKFLRDLKKQVSNGGLKIKVWDDKNIINNTTNFNTVNTTTTTTTTMETANLLIELIHRSKELNKAKTLNTILNDNGIDMSVRGLRSKGYNETHVWTRTPAMEKYLIAEGVTHEKVQDAVEKFQYAIDNPPAPYIPQPKPESTTAPAPKNTNATTTDKDIEEAANKVKENIIKMMQELTPKGNAADMEEVKKLIHESEERTSDYIYTAFMKLKEQIKPTIEKVYITPNVPEGAKVGTTHKQFDTLLKYVVAGRQVKMSVWITGGAGGGKTHAAAQVAEALNVKFASLSLCAQTTQSAIFGYQNANGNYISTTFRDCYEKGGLFCLDEIDNGNSNILAALNSALANGHASFPDANVKMNDQFYLIATANTTGNGATKAYVGRNQIDKSTIDRFIMLDWQYDEEIEKLISGNNMQVLNRVKELRSAANKNNLTCVISPRATAAVSALMRIGFDLNEAINAAITEKLTPQEKTALCL